MQGSFQASSFNPISKMLGNFKLPKFDGNSRYWKTWDKTFIRFLSIHQLDFVVEESFLDVLPLSPSDFGANKMVYYICGKQQNGTGMRRILPSTMAMYFQGHRLWLCSWQNW